MKRVKIKTKQLIEAVKQRPPLWDRHHEMRLDRGINQMLWEEVAVIIGESEKILRPKFKSLKDTYRREWKKKRINQNYDTPWIHYKQMAFLSDQIIAKDIDLSNTPHIGDENIPKVEIVYETIDVDEASSATPPQVKTRSKNKNNQPNYQYTCNDNEAQNSDDTFCENNQQFELVNVRTVEEDAMDCGVVSNTTDTYQQTEDEDMCFFKSLLPHVKQLSSRRKLLLRMKIQEMVYKEVYSNDL